jgi:cofilin
LIFWSPDDGPIMSKMLYASSKSAITTALNGIAKEYQANDLAHLSMADVIKKCKA